LSSSQASIRLECSLNVQINQANNTEFKDMYNKLNKNILQISPG